MTAFDPDTSRRLIAEHREDDGRMTDSPWVWDILNLRSPSGYAVLRIGGAEAYYDTHGIARLRNNAKPIADALEGAMMEIERLRAAAERGVSPSAHDSLVMYAGRADETLRMLADARAEVERLQPVAAAAVADHHAVCRCELGAAGDEHMGKCAKLQAEIALELVVHAYVADAACPGCDPEPAAESEADQLRGRMRSMRAVVAAAERWADDGSTSDEEIIAAVRAYRAARR